MSLLRPIIRTCAVAALRDKTWAQDRVFDSDQTPLAEAVLGEAAQPYIVVYTDADDRMLTGTMRMYDGQARLMSLVIEIGVASAVRDPDNKITIKFAATDQGMELAVDVIESQVIAALVGDPLSEWGEMFKRFVLGVQRAPSRRGGQGERGIRFAARRLVLQCRTIYDIPPGVIPQEGHVIWDFIALAEQHLTDEVVDVAGLVRQLLDVTQAPDWRVAQAYLGLSTQGIKNIVAETPLPWGKPDVEEAVEEPPLVDDPNEYPPPLEDITLDDGTKSENF